jgi:hypothetical protein
VWFEGYKSQVKYLLMKNKIVTDVIDKNIKEHIAATGGGIPESL